MGRANQNGATQEDIRKKDINYLTRLHEYCKKNNLDKMNLLPNKMKQRISKKDSLIQGFSDEVLYAAYLYVDRNPEQFKHLRIYKKLDTI